MRDLYNRLFGGGLCMERAVNLDFDEYKKIDAINWSSLKNIKRSPLYYRYAKDHPSEDSTRLARGRAAHTAIFELDRFMLDYACFEGDRRAGKLWEVFKKLNDGKTLLKADEYRKCVSLRRAVYAHKEAARILASGECEKTFQWIDAPTGAKCKARVDWLGANNDLVDLKTTNDVSQEPFGRTAARMMYHAQLAMYHDGIKAVTNHSPRVFIIAAELEPPHDVAVFQLNEDDICAGREEYRRLLRLVVDCEIKNAWPGVHPTLLPLLLPPWHVFREDEFTAIDVSTGEEVF